MASSISAIAIMALKWVVPNAASGSSRPSFAVMVWPGWSMFIHGLGILSMLPMTSITAMVSPSALPRDSSIAPITSVFAIGRMTFRNISWGYSPRVWALSR